MLLRESGQLLLSEIRHVLHADGAALTLTSPGKCSRTYTTTRRRVNRHPASISPTDAPTTHSNNKDMSDAPPAQLGVAHLHRIMLGCCFFSFFSCSRFLFESCWQREKLLYFGVLPPGTACSVIRILLCLPADFSLNQTPPPHHTAQRCRLLHGLPSSHTHTHTDGEIECGTSTSHIPASHSEH